MRRTPYKAAIIGARRMYTASWEKRVPQVSQTVGDPHVHEQLSNAYYI